MLSERRDDAGLRREIGGQKSDQRLVLRFGIKDRILQPARIDIDQQNYQKHAFEFTPDDRSDQQPVAGMNESGERKPGNDEREVCGSKKWQQKRADVNGYQ